MPEFSVRELSPVLLGDWLCFFDHDAFADNPDWAGCYCDFFHADHGQKPWDERTARENRTASSNLIAAGRLKGYLAYADGKPVGWCQAAPRFHIPNMEKDESLQVGDAGQVGSIVCFAVAQPYRHLGVAGRLLEAACSGLRAQGMTIAEAYPRLHVDTDAANYHGPLRLYLDAGFTVFREFERLAIVRKDLSSGGDDQRAEVDKGRPGGSA